ncbi:MAG TPA: sugar transferase [Candidatus Dormibacteraeota bacterium]
MALEIELDGDPYHDLRIASVAGLYVTYLKRLADIAISTVALFISFPIWLAAMLAIKVDSPGPIFFVQERVGLHGKPFRMIKFRTMRQDAEDLLPLLLAANEAEGPVFKLARDPRVTRVGDILRRSSLDELPQFINVLRGEMSVVGPRPPLPREVMQYRPADRVRLSVTPGITCLWQVSGRSRIGFEEWMELDRRYVRERSLSLDLQILLRTVVVVLARDGAY